MVGNGQADKQKKWHIEVGAPPKKLCDRSWNIRLNYFGPNWAQILLFLEKGIFLGKLTNTTIFYLLCPIMPQCLKIILADHKILGVEVLGQIGQKSPSYPYRGFCFFKINCYFFLLQIPHHNTIMIKKNY